MGEVRAVVGTPFTKEVAKEKGAAGGRKAQAQRRAEKADPSLKLNRKLPELFDDLLDAAQGRGAYVDLAPDKRLSALFKALEYGAGRPISRDKQLAPADPGEGDGIEQAGGLTVV